MVIGKSRALVLVVKAREPWRCRQQTPQAIHDRPTLVVLAHELIEMDVYTSDKTTDQEAHAW
jgi:hypothetical protein